MLIGMEITSLITLLGHFTRWLSTVHWMLARDKRRFGDQEPMGWWYVHQDFNRHRCASSNIISSSTIVIVLELSTPGNWPAQLRDDYRLSAVKFRSVTSPCWRWACAINMPPCSFLFLIHMQRHKCIKDVILYVLWLTQRLLKFHDLCFVPNLTQPHWWLWLGTAVQSVMVTIFKVFHS